MPDPTRMLIIRPTPLGAVVLPADTYVWLLRHTGDRAEIECGNQRGRVRLAALVACPVPRPPLATLRQLDSCFGGGDDLFVEVHLDRDRYFQLLCCKAHGRRFLCDTRGGIAMYDRLTLLDDSDTGLPEVIWSKYHAQSDDWLNYQGRTW